MDDSERLVIKDVKEQHQDSNMVPHISLSLVDCWVFSVFSCEQNRDDLLSSTQELMPVRDQAKKI